MGYRLIAISPDRLAKVRETIEKHHPEFLLLSDSQMVAAQAFGVAYRVDEATLTQLMNFGIDLEDASGEKHHQLPVPAVFLAGENGMIQFHYGHPDYKVRLDPELLLAAARILAK